MNKSLFGFLLLSAVVVNTVVMGGCSGQSSQDRTANRPKPTPENGLVDATPAPVAEAAPAHYEIVPPVLSREQLAASDEIAKLEPAEIEDFRSLVEEGPSSFKPQESKQPTTVMNPLRASRLSSSRSLAPQAKSLAPSPQITAESETQTKSLRIQNEPLQLQEKALSITAEVVPPVSSVQTTRSAKLAAPLLDERGSKAVSSQTLPQEMTLLGETLKMKSQPLAAQASEDPRYAIVKVFYGTDRLADNAAGGQIQMISKLFLPAAGAVILTLLFGVMTIFSARHKVMASLTLLSLATAISLGYFSSFEAARIRLASENNQPIYGNDRGSLELGVCEVSIPKTHQVGEVESPSILRLEIHEDEEKHIVLRSVERRSEEAFYDEVRQSVQRSENREVLVFIHGYNVAFDDAARRTAQIAYDLKFQGAPILYSWPSQGGLLQYTIDETNVVWTVPHLKQFLLDIAKNSDAQSINLIAHSMGNRALTSTLRDLSLELQEDARMFNQVVLAAPDIDADVFRNDIAPKIAKTANRITLYASSKDQALAASKSVHGYPRAGESGEGLVIIPEIETVDVTDVDLSLIGHSYIGSNYTLLEDLYELINNSLPAHQRHTVKPMVRNGLTYFLLQQHIHSASDPAVFEEIR